MPVKAQPPPESFTDLHFPLCGVDLSMGFDKQPNRQIQSGDYARTTPLGVNVRAYEPGTARARGGQRPGLVKYVATQPNGTNLIQDLNSVVVVGTAAPGFTNGILNTTLQILQISVASEIASSTTRTSTFTNPVTTGSAIIIFAISETSNPSNITDSKANVYTLARSASTNGFRLNAYFISSTVGSAGFSVTSTYVGAGYLYLVALEVAHPGTLSVDAGSDNAKGTGNLPANTGPMTTTSTGPGLIIAVVKTNAGTNYTGVKPSGYTEIGASAILSLETSYKLTYAAGTPNTTWTLPLDCTWHNMQVAFKLDAGTVAGLVTPQPTQSGRYVVLSAVSAGQVRLCLSGTGAWVIPTVATGTLNSSGVVRSAASNQKLWFADGTHYTYYDPAVNSVLPWTASSGTLPVDTANNTPRLICNWRGRIVLAGLPLDGQNWFMSAVSDPTNFNYAPTPFVSTQAVAGNNSPLGLIGDVITSLIPYSDDRLIFGGDHTVYQMSGDPADGGRIDLVTDLVGMAWGAPWAKDPQGVLYFVSNQTGIYAYSPDGSKPVRISQAIEQYLTVINTGTNIIRCQWDDRLQGLHVFVSLAASAAATTHFFWEQRTGAWWQDIFAMNNHNPLAMCIFDGNTAADRRALIGSWDGYVRVLEPAAVDDDGTPIASAVVIGPITTKDFDQILFKDVQALLGTASGTVNYAIYVGTTAEAALASTAVSTGTWGPGRNLTNHVRWAGHALFVKITATTYWAMEAIRCRIALLGKVQRRGH